MTGLQTPPLLKALRDYDALGRRRFHVPAHAGSMLLPPEWDVLREPWRYDLTELDGLDVLSEPSGCIAESQARTAELIGAAHSFFLVNGASVGLSAALLATLKPGDKILLPRNVHRSVISGLILTGAKPVWFLPDYSPDWGLWQGVTASQVAAQLEAHPDIRALVLTSPTYEGLGSEIAGIAALCQARGVLLIVDEAHGALWPFSEQLPASAVNFPCDAVIHSLHKCGGSLTQSALAHLPHGSRIAPDVFQQALNTLQTTSPSYLLMASLDATVHMLASEAGQGRIAALAEQVTMLRADLQANLSHLRLFEPGMSLIPREIATPASAGASLPAGARNDRQLAGWDPCKLYFFSPSEPGEDWGARLEQEAQLAYESVASGGVLYLANLGLNTPDFAAFRQILLAEDRRQKNRGGHGGGTPPHQNKSPILLPEGFLIPREAFFAPGERVSPESAIGRIAKETLVHCPPGIPILIPGERITPHHLPLLPDSGVLVLR